MTRLPTRTGLSIAVIVVSVALLPGCGDPVDPTPSEPVYSWAVEEHSLDSGLGFSGISGISDNLIFVVGSADLSDVIVKFENDNWTYVIPPSDNPGFDYLRDIHLHPSGFGYAVSRENIYRYLDGDWTSRRSENFAAVWVDGIWDAWAVAVDGLIWLLDEFGFWYEYDWHGFPGEEFTDICRIGDHGFIVGHEGVVVHTIGWSEAFEEDSGTSESLYGVWGCAPDTVFAVGSRGTIVRYDGELWHPVDSGVSAYLYGVWGTASDHVFAVGENGTILHYDGGRWTQLVSGVSATLRSVWGTSKTNVLAVGGNSTILRYGLEQEE